MTDRASVLLSQAELCELTRRVQPRAQARVLERLGVPYRPHPTDGVLLVAAEAVRAALGTLTQAANDEPARPSAYVVDVHAIRQHGTKAQAR